MRAEARRSPRMYGLLVPLVFAIAVLIARRAQADSTTLRLEYTAPQGCPRAETFVGELRRRLPRVRIVNGSERARELVVRVQGHEGQLLLRELDGSGSSRAVSGASCAEVVSALALIAAVAVDPTAAAETATATSTAATTNATATSTSTAPSATATTTSSAPAATSSGRDPHEPNGGVDGGSDPVEDAGTDRSRPGESLYGPPGWHFAIGAHAGVVSGVSPNALVSIPVFLELAHASGGVFEPTARVRFQRTGSGVISTSGASADFTWTAASINFCPVALPPSAFRVEPCARVEGGALAATGVDVVPVRSSTRPWFSAGPVVRARWAIRSQLFLEIEGSMAFPTIRDHFLVEPATTLFHAPPVGYGASAGAGISIW